MIDVSIIIVNYNTKELIYNCLKSIYSQTNDISFEIIVSDNGSIDGSIEMIKSEFPQVVLLENRDNLGFGIANNCGAKIANGKYLFLLNSDTLLLNNAVKFFYDVAESSNDFNILGTYLYKNNEIINSYGRFLTKRNCLLKVIYLYFPLFLKFRLMIKPLNFKAEEKYVEFITGADLFILKDIFLNLGGFDENIFMYCEDDDLCRRALKNGIRSKIITTPKIIHLEGQSSKVSKIKRQMLIKSYKYYISKWY